MEKIAEVVDLGELFADRARVRDVPGMRARSRRTILKSSSIEKNCLRSSSTWTSGVHRDKESLPNAKVQKRDWNTSARARRDCRVSTNPGARIGAERRVRRIRLHLHPHDPSIASATTRAPTRELEGSNPKTGKTKEKTLANFRLSSAQVSPS